MAADLNRLHYIVHMTDGAPRAAFAYRDEAEAFADMRRRHDSAERKLPNTWRVSDRLIDDDAA
jgi:chemotaxis regulatin CheY-phosphate phosphatase CheZ